MDRNMIRRTTGAILATFVAGIAWADAPSGDFAQKGILAGGIEENRGQFPAEIDFFGRFRGVQVAMTRDPLRLTILSPSLEHDPTAARGPNCVTLSFQGLRASSIAGEQQLDGNLHYLIGRNPNDWTRDVRRFAAARATDPTNGVELLLRAGNAGEPIYDMFLAPGASIDAIVVHCEGARNLYLDDTGALCLDTGRGVLRQTPPRAWSTTSAGERTAVDCEFRILGSNRFGFAAPGHFDARSPDALVIDPTFGFSTYLGGEFADQGWSTDLQPGQDAPYVCGETLSPTFPTPPGVTPPSAIGLTDAFVAKYTSAGVLSYVTFFGGTGNDHALAIDVASNGEAVMTGLTTSADFPVTVGAFQTTFSGPGPACSTLNCGDAFVVRFTNSGAAIVYASYLGGSDFDWGFDIELDGADRFHLTGTTGSANFPISAFTFDATYNGPNPAHSDAFYTVIDPTISGSGSLVYSSYLGGTGFDGATALALDSSGRAHLAISTESPNFPTTPGVYQPTCPSCGGGTEDAVVACFDAAAPIAVDTLVYSTFFGGTKHERGIDLAVDAAGGVYLVGETQSTDLPIQAPALIPPVFPWDSTLGGAQDAYVAKFVGLGTTLAYSTYIGGSNVDVAWAVRVDSAGAAYIVGTTDSSDFPTTVGAWDSTLGGGRDAFVTKVINGHSLEYSTFLGGSGEELGQGIALRKSRYVIVTGKTGSVDFPVVSGAFDPGDAAADAFVSRISFQ